MATPLSNTVTASGTNSIDGLVHGSKWSTGALIYSFWDSASGNWSAAEKQAMHAALDSLAAVANVTFTEITPTGSVKDNTSDLSFYFSALDASTLGLGYFPDPPLIDSFLPSFGDTRASYPTAEGDIQFNKTNEGWVNNLALGGDGFQTIIHELGHTLGLKHPHDDGANGKPTFNQLGLGSYDNYQYTMMSYNPLYADSLNAGNNSTPSVFDMQALQYIYGANTSYNATNTVYVMSIDIQLKAIWDAGGTDLLDASAQTGAVTLDLTEGAFSQHGAKSVTGIAYNTVIENATGGGGDDRLTGNNSNNILIGNSGNDTATGGNGDDAIYGNLGNDAVYGNAGNDRVFGGRDNDNVFGGQGSDAVYGNFENDIAYGNFGNDTIFGGKGDDVLYGGRDNDLILGNIGDDTLLGNGGDDTLTGGSGNDFFISALNGGNDNITDFTNGDLLRVNGVDTATLLGATTSGTDGAVISFTGGSITLVGVAVETVTEGIFA